MSKRGRPVTRTANMRKIQISFPEQTLKSIRKLAIAEHEGNQARMVRELVSEALAAREGAV